MRRRGVRCKRNEPVNEEVTRKEWERGARMRKRKRRKESTRHIHWFSVPSCRRFQRKYHGGRFERGDEPSHGNYPPRKEGPPSFFCGITSPSSLRPRLLSSYASNWLPFRKFLSFQRCTAFDFCPRNGGSTINEMEIWLDSSFRMEVVWNYIFWLFRNLWNAD